MRSCANPPATTLRPGQILLVLVRWVQTYLYSAAFPPPLQIGSVLPTFGPFYAVRAGITGISYGQTGRYSYVAPFLPLSFIYTVSWRGYCHR